jgi:hypothetical protein
MKPPTRGAQWQAHSVDAHHGGSTRRRGVLGDHDVEAGQNAPDEQAGEDAGGDHLRDRGDEGRADHPHGDEHEAADGVRAPAHAIGQRRDEQRAEGQADDARTEQIARLGLAEPPGLGQRWGDERHHEHFESVDDGEHETDADDAHLEGAHRLGGDTFTDVHDDSFGEEEEHLELERAEGRCRHVRATPGGHLDRPACFLRAMTSLAHLPSYRVVAPW